MSVIFFSEVCLFQLCSGVVVQPVDLESCDIGDSEENKKT